MAKSKTSKRKVKKVTKKHVLNRQVDNKLSILLIAMAILIFALAAVSMSR